MILREVDKGLMVSPDGRFFRNGKEKKVVYATNILGKKATAKLTIMIDSKVHYWQAAKLVAKAYLVDYEDGCNIIYKDGDIHKSSIQVLTDVSKCDFNSVDIGCWHPKDGDFADAWSSVLDDKKAVEMELSDMRDGLYDESERYYIFSKDEIRQMIGVLTGSLKKL